jgi:hypothetical protein
MSEKRSVIAFEHYREAEQRFEYFITGISTALCAYVGQTLQPQKFGFNPYTLEVLSVGLVVASIVLSFKRIESGIVIKHLNHDVLHMAEIRGELVLASLKGQPFVNELTGDAFTPAQTKERIANIERSIPIRQKQIERVQAKVLKMYRLRNWLLLCGFLGLFISKVLVPYMR